MSVFTFIFLVVLTVCLFGFLGKLLDTVRGGSAKADEGYGADDTKLMQDLHRVATRLEQRIDTLETLLLDPDGARGPAESSSRARQD